jgi:hypothetical protein
LKELGHTLVPFEINHEDYTEMESVYLGFARNAAFPNLVSLE